MNYKDSMAKRLALSGIILALALIMRTLSISIPIAGAPVMRFTFTQPFLSIVAILYGPLYGAIVFGLYDLLGVVIARDGAYIPLLTAVMCLQGLLTGLFARYIPVTEMINSKLFKRVFLYISILIGIFGMVNMVFINYLTNNIYSDVLFSIGKSANYTSVGLIIISALCLTVYFVFSKLNRNFINILLIIFVPSLLTTLLNTFVLKAHFLTGEGTLFVILVPRMIKTLLMIPLNTYLIALLMAAYQTAAHRRAN